MEKSKKIQIIIIIVCFLLVIGFLTFIIIRHNANKEVVTDAMKFKKEYEVYNNYTSEDTGITYKEVSIDSENPIVYKTGGEIVDILNNDNAVIYFGYPSSVESRDIIETLLEVSKENNLKELYYVNILNIRDEYEYTGSIEPKKVKEGTDAYYKIVEFLNDYLNNYYVAGENGFLFGTGVKRLEAPTIVAVSDGQVLDFWSENATGGLEKDELKDILSTLIKTITKKVDVCSTSEPC